jgi:hypothetical protein
LPSNAETASSLLGFYAPPVFAMVALTFGVLGVLGARRLYAIYRRQYPLRYFKLMQRPQGAEFPEGAEAAARNLINLFEVPVLFYALIPLLVLSGARDGFVLVWLWVFVGFRALHSAVHVTVNSIPLRFSAYLLSTGALGLAWIGLARILFF